MHRVLRLCALAAGALGIAIPSVTAEASTPVGYDVSWPQCPSQVPKGGAFGIVGVNDGIAWSQNPCLGREFQWAASRPGAPALYMNTADPGPQSTHWQLGGPMSAACDPSNTDTTSTAYAACAYDYGWNTAQDALTIEAQPVSNPASRAWWLDVETTNTWAGSGDANAHDVQGSIDYLRSAGVRSIGVYSTAYQWGVITAGYAFPTATPEWLAGAGSLRQAQSFCAQAPFGGAKSSITLTQYHSGGFDADLPC